MTTNSSAMHDVAANGLEGLLPVFLVVVVVFTGMLWAVLAARFATVFAWGVRLKEKCVRLSRLASKGFAGITALSPFAFTAWVLYKIDANTRDTIGSILVWVVGLFAVLVAIGYLVERYAEPTIEKLKQRYQELQEETE